MDKLNSIAQESFLPGDKWVYYQVYIGVLNANKFLCDYFFPVVRELKNQGVINKWFFIRYGDPEFHLRIRFELKHKSNFDKVVSVMHDCFCKPFCQESIWEVQLNTYHRELERYGKNTIDLAEEVFYLDSEIIASVLKNPDYKLNGIEWKSAIYMILCYLDGFRFDLADKIQFIQKVKDAFANEFKLDKSIKVKMAKNYRIHCQHLDKAIDNFNLVIADYDYLEKLKAKLKENNKNFNENIKSQILSSLIHMSLNRLFVNKNREQEFLCYDFLLQILKTKRARKMTK